MFNVVVISDTHGRHKYIDMPLSGDLIIHAGDSTSMGELSEIETFLQWFGSLEYEMKVLISGNHDFGFERFPNETKKLCDQYGVILLNDSEVIFKGVKIWGSPVQPEFGNWAFNRARTKETSCDFGQKSYTNRNSFIGTHWDKIPHDVDILITHGPPFGILDLTYYRGDNAGCEILDEKIKKIRPVLHVFGHIHERRGVLVDKQGATPITHVNASCLDINYKPYKDPAFVFNWYDLIIGQSRGCD